MRINALFFISAFSLLSACSSITHKNDGNTDTLANLQKLSSKPPSLEKSVDSISAIREEALKDTAMTVGAQSGLHWRAQQINEMLTKDSKTLDQVFDFNGVLLEHNVLPPVLTEARQILNISGTDVIRLADRTYEIVSQAKFVTTSPTWRDYLWLNYPQPEVPDKSVLPQTRAEVNLWRKSVAKGWEQGVLQANQIYDENLSRLKRDYTGMMLYRKLHAQNMVSAPFVAKTELGITGDGSNLSINDTVLRITALPTLQPNSKHWKPALSTQK